MDPPPKKRRYYETRPPSPPPPPSSPPPPPPPPPPPREDCTPPPPPPPAQPESPPRPPPLRSSQEEVLQKRRNNEELRTLFDCYRRIRQCVDSKDTRLMPDLEQAYLALVAASRGCTSVQRVVAELIPRYASFCPTALEAAANVTITMYDWSLKRIATGEDSDSVAHQTAKACILGLVDISFAASAEALTSSAFGRICSTVYVNVLTFFSTDFNGKDICQIGISRIRSLEEPLEFLHNLKQETEDVSLSRLYELRVFSLLIIFFSCPKNFLEACFELLASSNTDECQKKGLYIIHQLTSPLYDESLDGLAQKDEAVSLSSLSCDAIANSSLNSSSSAKKSVLSPNNCYMAKLMLKDPSLRVWFISNYKKLNLSVDYVPLSKLSTYITEDLGNSSDDIEANCETVVKDSLMKSAAEDIPHLVKEDNVTSDIIVGSSCSNRKDTDVRSNEGSIQHFAGRVSEIGPSDDSDVHLLHNEIVKEPFRPERLSRSRMMLQGLVSDGQEGLSSNIDGLKGAGVSPSSTSSRQHTIASKHQTENNFSFYNDSTSNNVLLATKQLWAGNLGPNATEVSLRSTFANFGPIDNVLFCPAKNFLLVEYKNVLDAVKACIHMQSSTIWGGFLQIKYVDRLVGSRGYVNGNAVGESRQLHIGNVQSHREQDYILDELKAVGLRRPSVVTYLCSENALVIEFETALEAAIAKSSIRCRGSELSSPAHHNRSKSTVPEIFSPRSSVEARSGAPGMPGQESNWIGKCSDERSHGRPENAEEFSYGSLGRHTGPPVYDKLMLSHDTPPEIGQNLQALHRPAAAHYSPVAPSPLRAPFVRPICFSNSNSWDSNGPSHSANQSSASASGNFVGAPMAPLPFIPSSVTPLAQLQGNMPPRPHSMSQVPSFPPGAPIIAQRSTMPPPSPVPPIRAPSSVPTPKSSLPLQHSSHTEVQGNTSVRHHQWQGALSKSGVHYCNIYASREDSDSYRYRDGLAEPAGWPLKLDVTKRTDFNHVKANFVNTPSNRKEICRLFPASAADSKGFRDFIAYLKQRECAGVIKIQALQSMWTRLLFILPQSADVCEMLSVPSQSPDCLIALILPKEPSTEAAT